MEPSILDFQDRADEGESQEAVWREGAERL